jgi:hypothetical protein
MITRATIAILCLGFLIGCGSSDKKPEGGDASTRNNNAELEDGSITVTIDGRKATPLEQEAFSHYAKMLLSDALPEILEEMANDVNKKLDIDLTDRVEADLLSVSFPSKPETSTDDQMFSIYLIRPGNEIKEPRTTSLLSEGKPVVRFTRATAPVERPIAVMSMTGTKNGRITQTDMFLVYGSDKKWKLYRPTERTESLKDDRK